MRGDLRLGELRHHPAIFDRPCSTRKRGKPSGSVEVRRSSPKHRGHEKVQEGGSAIKKTHSMQLS